MSIDELERKLEELVRDISTVEDKNKREEVLIEIGMYAAQLDIQAYGTPEESEIRIRTDQKVEQAENDDKITHDFHQLRSKLPSITRKVKKKVKI